MFSGGVLRGSVNRIPDLLDALRQEYETVIEDMGVCKAQRDDYERKCFPPSLPPNVPSHLFPSSITLAVDAVVHLVSSRSFCYCLSARGSSKWVCHFRVMAACAILLQAVRMRMRVPTE